MKSKGAAVVTAVILVIAFCLGSIMFVATSREWFMISEDSRIVTTELTGQASVTRGGTGYSLKTGIGLRKDDTVITAAGSGAVMSIGGIGSFTVDEASSFRVTDDSDDAVGIQTEFGTVLFSINDPAGLFRASSPAGTAACEGECLFSVDSYPGTQTVRVYLGRLVFTPSSGDEATWILPGQQLTVTQNDDGLIDGKELSDISIKALNGFLLEKLTESTQQSVFTPEELKSEEDRRIQETEAAIAEKQAYEEAVLAQGGTVPVISSTRPVGDNAAKKDVHTCTITIVCTTVLDNMDSLSEGLASSIPPNGVMLGYSTVEFVEGENVYDVLKKACGYAGIGLEYSWTVEYGGYYIEGIGGLGEFDCGPDSGWMYSVNGWFPHYSCSNYTLKDGDMVIWAYTCRGLGEDLGLEWTP